MSAILSGITTIPTEKLQATVEVINETVATDKIFLLGYTSAVNTSADIFMPALSSHQYPFACTLLVLVSKSSGKKPCNLEDTIEKRCRPFLPVTAFIQTIETFIEKNNSGDFFTGIVLEQAMLLYDAGTTQAIMPCSIDTTAVRAAAENHFRHNLNRAKEFLMGAELFILRHQHAMAAFMLHQAVEHGLLTLFKTITGFRVQTHNLEKLFRYCYSFSGELCRIFPRHTDKEERLFRLMQQAYLDTRYSDTYSISKEELHLLSERVRSLHKIIETVTGCWLEHLDIKQD